MEEHYLPEEAMLEEATNKKATFSSILAHSASLILIGIIYAVLVLLLELDRTATYVIGAALVIDLVLTVPSYIFFRAKKKAYAFKWLHIAADSSLVLSIIYFTGGLSSDIIFLIILPVLVGWYNSEVERIAFHVGAALVFLSVLALGFTGAELEFATLFVPTVIFVLTAGLISLSGIRIIRTDIEKLEETKDELRGKIGQLEVMGALSTTFLISQPFGKMVSVLASRVAKGLNLNRVAIFLFDTDKKAFTPSSFYNLSPKNFPQSIPLRESGHLQKPYNTKEAVIIPNAVPYLRRGPAFLRKEKIREYAYFPLFYQDRFLGVMAVFDQAEEVEEKLDKLQAAQSQAALMLGNATLFRELLETKKSLERTIAELQKNQQSLSSTIAALEQEKAKALKLAEDNARLLDKVNRRVYELSVVADVSRVASELTDFDKVARHLAEILNSAMRAKATAVFMTADDGRTVKMSASYGFRSATSGSLSRIKFNLQDGFFKQILRFRRPLIITDFERELKPLGSKIFEPLQSEGFRSIFAVPLMVRDEVIGTLSVFYGREHEFSEDELLLFSTIANEAASLVDNANLYQKIELAKSRDEAILNSISDGIIVVDKTQDVVFMNKAAELITGQRAKDMIGQSCLKPFNFTEQDTFYVCSHKLCPRLVCMDTGQGQLKENVEIVRPDGSKIFVNYRVAPNTSIKGNVIGAVIAFNDVTKELELERAKAEFLSIASHEIRTPLTAIKGNLEMILGGEEAKLSPDAKEEVEDSYLASKRLLKLISDMLSSSNLEEGKMKFVRNTFDVSDSIKSVIKELKPIAELNKLKLNYTKPRNISTLVSSDEAKIREVLVNLIGNALNYTRRGSVTVSNLADGNNLIINVSDTGIGIKKDDMQNLFKKFSKAGPDAPGGQARTGLGLYISKMYIDKLGGRIWAESTYGKGSKFSFSLPLARKKNK